MSAELVPAPPPEAPVAPREVHAAPVAVPPAVVAAIARAAVEAYVEAKRAEVSAYNRAYRAANREQLLARERLRRQEVRAAKVAHEMPKRGSR